LPIFGFRGESGTALTQALSYLRGSGFDCATFQTMAAQQRAFHDARRRSVGYGQMIMNSR
jgi:hypothetical protein